jgi:hypothetical protein
MVVPLTTGTGYDFEEEPMLAVIEDIYPDEPSAPKSAEDVSRGAPQTRKKRGDHLSIDMNWQQAGGDGTRTRTRGRPADATASFVSEFQQMAFLVSPGPRSYTEAITGPDTAVAESPDELMRGSDDVPISLDWQPAGDVKPNHTCQNDATAGFVPEPEEMDLLPSSGSPSYTDTVSVTDSTHWKAAIARDLESLQAHEKLLEKFEMHTSRGRATSMQSDANLEPRHKDEESADHNWYHRVGILGRFVGDPLVYHGTPISHREFLATMGLG